MSARVYVLPGAWSWLQTHAPSARLALEAAIDRISADPGGDAPFRFAAPRDLDLGPVVLDVSAKVGESRLYVAYRVDPGDPSSVHILDIGTFDEAPSGSAG